MKKLVSVPIVIGTIPITDSNLPSPNLNIRYFKSVLNRKGNCEQYFKEEKYEKDLLEDEKGKKMEPKYPYYKDFYLDKY